MTEHPTAEGNVYLATVIDVYSRRVVGWSIVDHGSTYTIWAFGRRLRAAGILGSMGAVGDALDNARAESFFGTLQLELLDRRRWQTRAELASPIFEYIEAFYNPGLSYSCPMAVDTPAVNTHKDAAEGTESDEGRCRGR